MFSGLLSSVGKIFWSSEEKRQVELQGSLYSLQKNFDWKCIYNNCVACNTPSDDPFSVFLDIVPDTEDENDRARGEYKRFLLTKEMLFSKDIGPCGRGFSFNHESQRYLFEFASSSSEILVNAFLKQCCEALYSHTMRKPASSASAEDLEMYIGIGAQSKPVAASKKMTLTKLLPEMEGKSILASASGSLYCDSSSEDRPADAPPTFDLIDRECMIVISNATEGKDFAYFLYACTMDEIHVGQEINEDMNARTVSNQRALVWTTQSESGVLMWSFKMADEDEFVNFKESFIQAMYEQKSQEAWHKTKNEDRGWYRGVLGQDRDEASNQSDSEEERSLDAFEDDEAEDNEFARASSGGEHNSLLSVGKVSDRSFVVRGNKIGVFGVEDGDLSYRATIQGIQTLSSKEVFSPKKAYLHRADQSMLLLNPDDSTKVFKMDLERGKVVEEWQTPAGEMRLFDLIPETKEAQRTDSPTVIGLNNCGFFVMDERTPEKVVKGRNFQYNGERLRFRAGATTANGHFALGTASGDIRLYNANSLVASPGARSVLESSKPRARTNLPGCGDPIIGLEVTADGEWVLATCKTYLLVSPTCHEDINGFVKSLGEHKPSPRVLRLKPEHVALVGGVVNFKSAHFNMGLESSIVASTGKAVVTWNFEKVKKGYTDSYVIKVYKDEVVANNFARYGRDTEIIVALPDDVKLARKTALQTK